MIKHALLSLFAITLSACTIVQVQGGSPATSVHLGILKIDPAPGARSISYRIRGIGIVPSLNGATIGYSREDVVLAYRPEDCRIVLFDWPAERVERRDLAAQLANSDICQPGGTR